MIGIIMNQEKVANLKEQIKKLEAEMAVYENKSPGRDRVVSLQVKLTALHKQLEEETQV